MLVNVRERVCELSDGVLVSASISPSSYRDVEIQTDASISASIIEVEQLKKQLLDAQTKHDEEQQKLTGLVK